MKGSFFSLRGRNHFQKTMHNVRVTLLCGLLTFLVLRSSLGAGKFGTPVQDYDEIRHHLQSLRLRHHHKLLIKREPGEAVAHKDASRSTLSLPTSEEGYVDGASMAADNVNRASVVYDKVGHKAYSMVRREPSSTGPRILLVTGSQATPCESAIEAQFLLKALKNKMDYGLLHGIEVLYDAEATDASARSHVLPKLMLSHPEVEWIWWMDNVAVFTDMSFNLPIEKYAGYNVVVHGGGNRLHSSNEDMSNGDGLGLGGSFLLRNCDWSRDYLVKGGWMQGRGEAEEVLVDIDEMKMERYRPGIGEGESWPAVTHFSRCNLCGKYRSCLSHMERAFIFADSQHKHVGALSLDARM